MIREFKDLVFRSILAGIFIGFAGFGFLADKTIGTFLFIFGLAAIIKYKALLFTGTSGFINNFKDFIKLLFIWGGNFVGCYLVGQLALYSNIPIYETANKIIDTRIDTGWIACGILSIGCGILMTTAVRSLKKDTYSFGNWVPLFFAIPLFIVCGLPHCIADIFYYSVGCRTFGGCYWITILGNFIGCNIPRIFIKNE